jgi:hypothetical protein
MVFSNASAYRETFTKVNAKISGKILAVEDPSIVEAPEEDRL